ncbi:M23 family metallopeptidase, partial [Patescibacteria group bacterium AH-259-L05]|nr:M23 family metallopeptidase [Patescibacteria group bacterium AH-259-L05]
NSLRTQLQESLDLKTALKDKKAKLKSEEQTTQIILDETRGAEWKFQSLLAEVIEEHQKVENEIITLEREARKKIAEEKEKKAELMEAEGIIVFSWSVPNEGITATFHDPDYPYRTWIGEHSGIDLRASQGTAVRAAASGYVARAKHGGLGYSYIMFIHNDEFSTVYGHISEILVEEGEYIRRGSIIARSGGLPGTSGAGKFSTGPHLHFEVRLNGIPVNPEDYLL